MNLVALTTRPEKIPPDYRAQATRVIAFHQHEPRDLDYLAEIMGEKAYQLPNLPRFKFIEWKEGDWNSSASSSPDTSSPPSQSHGQNEEELTNENPDNR